MEYLLKPLLKPLQWIKEVLAEVFLIFSLNFVTLKTSAIISTIVYFPCSDESFYYSSEYIKQIDDTPGVVVWEEQLDEDKRKRELLQMKGKRCLIKSNPLIFCQIICTKQLCTLKLIIYIWSHIICLEFLHMLANVEINAINKLIIYNVEATQPWVALYEEQINKWDSDRKHSNGWMVMPYLDHLKLNVANMYLNDWVVDQIMEKYGRFRH